MNKKPNISQKIAAFTIFEVTVVVAILGVLISIIATTLNRLNEQLKVTSDIHQELNLWHSFRSNLWREFYESDSIQLGTGILSIYDHDNVSQYKVEEERLQRFVTNEWKDVGFAANSIQKSFQDDYDLYTIQFLWKGELLDLSYPDVKDSKNTIDNYFRRLNE